MQTESSPVSTGLTPRVVAVSPLPDSRLALEWETGERSTFDASPYVGRGVFEPLTDPRAFSSVAIANRGAAIEWPCGADLCVDTLYAERAE